MWENETPLHQISDSKTQTPFSRGTVGFFFEVVRLGEFGREHGLITLLDTLHQEALLGFPQSPDSERGEEYFKITL